MLRGYLCILCCVWTAGCTTSGSLESLESRLRGHEDRISELQSNLDDAHSQLALARRENSALRQQLADRGQKSILPEQADVLYRASGIKFSELMTGGLDQDAAAGDELLNVVLVPHDADGDVVKLPGWIQLDALDLSRADNERLIGRWKFSLDESRAHWDRTWFGSGYQFSLPWQQLPLSDELLLHAKLTTPDRREFDASTTIQVNPPTQSSKLIKQLAGSDKADRRTAVAEPRQLPQQPPTAGLGRSRRPAPETRTAPAQLDPPANVPALPFRRIPDADNASSTPGDSDKPASADIGSASIRTPRSDSEPTEAARRLSDTELPVFTSDRWTDATIPRLR